MKAFVNSNSLQTEINKDVVDGEVTTIIKKIETTESDELDSNLNLLITALRFNHNISGDINNLYVKDVEHEIEV